MINNEVLKRIRYILDLNENQLQEVFAAAENPVSSEQLNAWLDKSGGSDSEKLEDVELAVFLNGLINFKRGKKEGAQPEPEKKINKHILSLADSGVELSPHELTALFRKKTHKHYRACKDEVLISFLNGLKIQFRDDA